MFGGFFGGGFGGFPRGGRFEASYRVYPVTFIDKADAERGDKVFLPPSALDTLAQLHIDYPMLFKVENRRDGRSTHCGVLEFVADEGVAYMPYWMMQNLLLGEGDVVSLSSATLPKGTYVKLQPHSTDFLDISNPRAVLETTLRSFSCLTVGDTIPINYNSRRYFIDIVEAKPGDAISVIETDCNVDFAPPLDYVEPARQPAAPEPMAAGPGPSAAAPAAPDAPPPEPQFLAFAGRGARLDGRPVGESRPVAIPLAGGRPGASGSGAAGGGDAAGSAPGSGSASAAGSAPKKSGKIMFRDRLAAKFGDGKGKPGAAAAPAAPPPAAKEEKREEPEKKFEAFKGTGYRLK